MPHDHPYVKLLVLDAQQCFKRSGTNDTLTALREMLLKSRKAVGKVVRSCTLCHRMDGSAYPPVGSHDLPSDRVSKDPPFAHVDFDFVGPLYAHFK